MKIEGSYTTRLIKDVRYIEELERERYEFLSEREGLRAESALWQIQNQDLRARITSLMEQNKVLRDQRCELIKTNRAYAEIISKAATILGGN